MSAKIGGRHKHMFQNKNFARSKSHTKYRKAYEWYVTILKKEWKPWFEKWAADTKVKAEMRFKKFWITKSMVDQYLEKRWLKI